MASGAVDLSLDVNELHGEERNSVQAADGKGVLIRYDLHQIYIAMLLTWVFKSGCLPFSALHCKTQYSLCVRNLFTDYVEDLVRKAIDFRYYYPTGQVPYFYRSHVGMLTQAIYDRIPSSAISHI